MRNFCILCLLLILTSCGAKNETEVFLEKHQFVLAVPLHGCSDCIEKALNWMAKNKSQKKIAFLIVGNSREKSVKQFFNNEDFLSKNLHFDTAGFCIKNDILSAQPVCIVKNSNGKQEISALTDANFEQKIAALEKDAKIK